MIDSGGSRKDSPKNSEPVVLASSVLSQQAHQTMLKNWCRPISKLTVFKDLPRLSRGLKVVDGDGSVVRATGLYFANPTWKLVAIVALDHSAFRTRWFLIDFVERPNRFSPAFAFPRFLVVFICALV